MPAPTAFEIVLDDKIHDVAAWTGVGPRPVARAVAASQPAGVTILWPGDRPNPAGIHAFAAARRDGAPGHQASQPADVGAAAVPASRVRPDRGHCAIPIENLQHRLALAEFVEAGLDPSAKSICLQDLKRAYRLLARRYHPDGRPSASESEQLRCAARFAHITAAFHVLTDATPAAA